MWQILKYSKTQKREKYKKNHKNFLELMDDTISIAKKPNDYKAR